MNVLVVTGCACSGKSTFVEKKMKDNDLRWDYDKVLQALSKRKGHTTERCSASSIAQSLRREVFWQLTEANKGETCDVGTFYIIADEISDHLREQLDMFDSWEQYEMETSKEECLKRLENDDTRPDKAKWKKIIEDYFEKKESRNMSTPTDKTKFKDNAQCRSIVFKEDIVEKLIDTEYYVEGYAARFEPYVLYKDANGEDIYEQFDKDCFRSADMNDIILQYDHSGRVFARTSNGSLIVKVDDKGLFIAADLGRTEEARKLYEDIKTGMVTKMSWRFSLGDYEYKENTRTIYHNTISKVFDVSAVSIPANDSTSISCRNFGNGVIEEVARRDAENEDIRNKMKIKLKLMETNNEN